LEVLLATAELLGEGNGIEKAAQIAEKTVHEYGP